MGAEEDEAAGGASKATATLVLVAVAGLLVPLTQSLLVPVLPQLALDLHASATSTEWLLPSLSAYRTLFAICAAAAIAGAVIALVIPASPSVPAAAPRTPAAHAEGAH